MCGSISTYKVQGNGSLVEAQHGIDAFRLVHLGKKLCSQLLQRT